MKPRQSPTIDVPPSAADPPRAAIRDVESLALRAVLADSGALAANFDDSVPEPARDDENAFREASILLVDDDPVSIQILGRILAELGDVRFATCGADALRLVHETIPDLILLDAEMPRMSGFELCSALKGDPDLEGVPVIFVTSHAGEAFEVSGFNHGAADFIAKPVSAPLVLVRAKTQLRMKRMADELQRMATTDLLTGVSNRRGFDKALRREWRRARRTDGPLSLLMIDVDHFKLFNDRYGHLAGDTCLRSVARALAQGSQRAADAVARYGGEEFVILLSETSRIGAAHVAHEILAAVEGLRIVHEGSPTSSHLSVSIGVACYDSESACWVPFSPAARLVRDAIPRPTSLDLVDSADKALYAAKRAGRAQGMFMDIANAGSPDSTSRLPPKSCTPDAIAHAAPVDERGPSGAEAPPRFPESPTNRGR